MKEQNSSPLGRSGGATLRLILGDQLNSSHSWFSTVDNDVTYVMAEMHQETDYVKHHIQKVVGFFLSMRNFAQELADKGHKVIYHKIGDSDNIHDLEKIIKKHVEEKNIERFEYQLPDEWRLDEQLKKICNALTIESTSR